MLQVPDIEEAPGRTSREPMKNPRFQEPHVEAQREASIWVTSGANGTWERPGKGQGKGGSCWTNDKG